MKSAPLTASRADSPSGVTGAPYAPCVTTVLSFALSAAALLVSVLAAIYSRRQASVASEQLELARQIRTEASEPYVIVDIVPQVGGTGMLLLKIENTGPTMARDVQLNISPPLQGGLESSWDEQLARVVARRIPFLPPGRRIEWPFAMGYTIFDNDSLPHQYTVTVAATGPSGPVEPLVYVIDLDAIHASLVDHGSVEASLIKIVEHTRNLEGIAGALRGVAGQSSGHARGVPRWAVPNATETESSPVASDSAVAQVTEPVGDGSAESAEGT